MTPVSRAPTNAAIHTGSSLPKLRKAAEALEASFLSEMLKAAGLDSPLGAFGGGIGEDQFSSFFREEQARLLASNGGIGLAETIFQSLLKEQGQASEHA